MLRHAVVVNDKIIPIESGYQLARSILNRGKETHEFHLDSDAIVPDLGPGAGKAGPQISQAARQGAARSSRERRGRRRAASKTNSQARRRSRQDDALLDPAIDVESDVKLIRSPESRSGDRGLVRVRDHQFKNVPIGAELISERDRGLVVDEVRVAAGCR